MSHDLAVVEHIGHRVAVMDLGEKPPLLEVAPGHHVACLRRPIGGDGALLNTAIRAIRPKQLRRAKTSTYAGVLSSVPGLCAYPSRPLRPIFSALADDRSTEGGMFQRTFRHEMQA